MKNLKKIVRTDAAFEILDNSNCAGTDWGSGGCAILAQALNKLEGYPMVVIYNLDYEGPEHFGVMTPSGTILDHDGEHKGVKAWLNFFVNNERPREGALTVMEFTPDMNMNGIKFDSEASDKLAELIRNYQMIKETVGEVISESEKSITLYHKVGGKRVFDIQERVNNVIKNGLQPYDPAEGNEYSERGDVIWFAYDYNQYGKDGDFVLSIEYNDKNKEKFDMRFDGQYATAKKPIPFKDLTVVRIPVIIKGDKAIANEFLIKLINNGMTPEKLISTMEDRGFKILPDIFEKYVQPYIKDDFMSLIKSDIKEINEVVANEEVWYHGTPDVREIEKEGGFTQRYLTIDYVENPEEWDRRQQALADARESGNEKEYFNILSTVSDLRKQAKIRKPIFLTDVYSVARTYADPHRAFDYQNAEEKVLKVKFKGGRGVTINAPGSGFRFINVEPVRQGFINAGVDPDNLDTIIRQLNFATGTKDGIKTDDIAAIGDWLGFDYIDVKGVLDSYRGGSTKSTVRMVFDPSHIEMIKSNQQLNENLQLADKIYFTPGRLSPRVREIIVDKITGGDPYTKIITDIYYAILQDSHAVGDWAVRSLDDPNAEIDRTDKKLENDVLRIDDWKTVKSYYQQLKAYNKNVFPIEGYNLNGVEDIWNLIRALNERAKILEDIKKLPAVAIRNMRGDFRQERNSSDMNAYRIGLNDFLAYYSLLGNRDARLRKTIENKMFVANVTLEDLLRFVEEKENLVGGAKFTKKSIKKLVLDNDYDMEIVYDKGNVMVVDVTSPDGIKKVGCNSLWCFTYGKGFDSAWRDWNNYSTNDHVYVIIDFSEQPDSPEFMHVLIKPLNYKLKPDEEDEEINDHKLFNMANEESYHAIGIVNHLIGEEAPFIMHFDEPIDVDMEGPSSKYPYEDPNQLSLFEYIDSVFNVLNESDEPSPTFEWDIAKEKIDDAKKGIFTKEQAYNFLSNLLDKVKSLPDYIKTKITKYTAISLIAILGAATINGLVSQKTPEISQKVYKAIENAMPTFKKHENPRSVSSNLIDFIKWEEGSIQQKGEPVLKAYQLGDGMITVGWGHAEKIGDSKLRKGDVITVAQAENLLKNDIANVEIYLNDILDKWKADGIDIKLDQGKYDAMASMIFNMGIGNFRRSDFIQLVKQGKYDEAAERILTTNVTYPGHVTRREKESQMFSGNDKTRLAMKEIRNIVRQVLRESVMTETTKGSFIAYHGTDHEINKFEDSFLASDRTIQHHGAGIYFATSEENARMFGNNLYKVKITGNFISTDNPKSDVNPKDLEKLMKLSDEEWELEAQNYHPDPEVGLRIAIKDALEYGDNEADVFMRVQSGGWYLYDRLGYVRNMTKIGIDGMIVDAPSDWVKQKHIIVFNPDAIEILERLS